MSKALSDVIRERDRQRLKWGDGHDDIHGHEKLAVEASYFLVPSAPDFSWAAFHKDKGERQQLVRGAALALAALECYDRAHE